MARRALSGYAASIPGLPSPTLNLLHSNPTPHALQPPGLRQALSLRPVNVATMLVGCLLLALAVAGGHSESNPECTEQQEQEVASKVSACLVAATFQFEEVRDSAEDATDVREAVCLLLAQAVDGCASLWKECHNAKEVKRKLQTSFFLRENTVGRF